MSKLSSKQLQRLKRIGISMDCAVGHKRQFLIEDGWVYCICVTCQNRFPLTIAQMEAYRTPEGLSVVHKGDPLFKIFGREQTALYELLETEAVLKDVTPTRLMFSILQEYLGRLVKKRALDNRATRRARIVTLFRQGMSPDEIAVEMERHVSSVREILRKEGVMQPRAYKLRKKALSVKGE